MDYQKLVIRGISYSQNQSGAYALLLEHEPTNVKLPIVIGSFEAQSITLGLEKDIKPMRPLTHDLFTHFVKSSHHSLESVVIHQILEGVFFSNLHFRDNATKEAIILDARTSDAVAMAVRLDAPIYTTQEVLDEAGILLHDVAVSQEIIENSEEVLDFDDGLAILPTEELHRLLEQAVSEEDFDTAVEIQEELKRRIDK